MDSKNATDILNKNLDCMKKYRPMLYSEVKNYLDKSAHKSDKFTFVHTKEGNGTLEINYKKTNIRLNSLYNPEKEAERWVAQFNFVNINISVLMFGIANGVYCDAILNKLEKDSMVILLEPDRELFVYCLRYFNMTRLISDNRIQIYIEGINEGEFHSALQNNINAIMIPSMIVCSYPGFDKIYKANFEKFKREILEKVKLEYILNFALEDRFKAGIDNTLKNLHFIKESNYTREFSRILPNDVPVIIVSSGPSLDKNIKDLKKAKNKAFIIAVDTAVQYLSEYGVNYDAIITIDPFITLKHFNCDDCWQYPIFAGIKSSNEVLEHNSGRKIFMISSLFMSDLYRKHNLEYSAFTIGGSVATDAFNVAVELGAKRIIFVGQDLAFGGEFSHAGQKNDYEKYMDEDIKYVEDIYGNTIKTRSDWVRYLDWFNDEIAKLNGTIDVIDATEGGAKINGTRVMKLSDAIDKYCNNCFDFKQVISEKKLTFSDEQYIEVKKDIVKMKKELEIIKEKAEYGIKITEGILNKKNGSNLDRQKELYINKKIKEINEFIESQLVYSIIYDYMETKMSGILDVNCFTGDTQKDTIRSYELIVESLNAVIDVVDYTYQIFIKAIENL